MLISWKESYDKPRQCVEKQRHHFVDKGLYSQSYGFSSSQVWMWESNHKEGWVSKNCCFWIWCWRRLLRVLWTAKRSNQSILKEINPEYSLKGLMLKLQYFIHLMQRVNHWNRSWCCERLKAKGKELGREWNGYIASLTQWMWIWTNSRR